MNQTPDSIANEILLTRNTTSTLIILVEGTNDEKAFAKFITHTTAEFIIGWGKDNVLSAINILDKEGCCGVLGIVDADFWHLDNPISISSNVLITDDHDIEMMMIRSRSFEYFLKEVGSPQKVTDFMSKTNHKDIRDVLLGKASLIGFLRRRSCVENLNLKFEGLKFNKFIDKDTLGVDIEKMIELVLSLTQNPLLNRDEFVAYINQRDSSNSPDLYQICCGHDVINILGIGLRKCLGSKSLQTTEQDVLESQLRMSYDSNHFRQTKLYDAAQKWEIHSGYKVFD